MCGRRSHGHGFDLEVCYTGWNENLTPFSSVPLSGSGLLRQYLRVLNSFVLNMLNILTSKRELTSSRVSGLVKGKLNSIPPSVLIS